jgi:hypothetical protein
LVVARYSLTRPALAATTVGWAALLTGCAGQLVAPVHGSAARTTAASGPAGGSARSALAAQYLVIARAGNERLEDDFDPLEGRDRNHLAAAQADLRDAAATERLFDRRILRIGFPPETERVARHLYRINQARAGLTAAAAVSTSLKYLHAYEPLLDAANEPVEQAVETIRRQLGLPPPSTS